VVRVSLLATVRVAMAAQAEPLMVSHVGIAARFEAAETRSGRALSMYQRRRVEEVWLEGSEHRPIRRQLPAQAGIPIPRR